MQGTLEEREEVILDILKNSIAIHDLNNTESIYLIDYLYGLQDIYSDKVKLTRTEIDNKCVENWAYAIEEFKKSYLLGKPIQYVQLNDSGEEEIALLNKYVRYENKKAKDLLLYEDMLTCGRGFRYINTDTINNDDEAPFEIINCAVEDTEVVYSSRLGNEQLLSYVKTSQQHIVQQLDPQTGKYTSVVKYYNEYTVYTRNMTYFVNDKSGMLQVINSTPMILNEHIITEYYLNKRRIGLIELGKDLFNDINYLESLDKDDMEQFVNSIMVFTNAEIDEEAITGIKTLGAVSITSSEGKKASVELLQSKLNSLDTQTYYTRLLTSLHQILGVPMSSDSGSVTSGDTGKAKLTGQGFTSAGIRAETDETMFGMCDMNSLKVILKICKESAISGIRTLKASDIDIKFQRDMSDNLLVKTQGLLNLYACDIPRKYANSIIGLFGDSNAVTKEQASLFGEQTSQQKAKLTATSSNKDTTNGQNNDITSTTQTDLQGN